ALDWNEPVPLVDGYRRDSRFLKVIDAFEEFKMISQCIVEGLDLMLKEEYIHSISYFYKALEIEDPWLRSMILNDDVLKRAKMSELFEQAIKDAKNVYNFC
ncbi:hypothetical protein C2G38_2051702, partial [Gigaspora rosea]